MFELGIGAVTCDRGAAMTDQYFGSSDAREPDRVFRPDQLDRSIISIPLLQQLANRPAEDPVSVVFDLNLLFPRGEHASGLAAAGARVAALLNRLHGQQPTLPFSVRRQQPGSQHLLATLSPVFVRQVVALDLEAPVEGQRAIFHVWPDFEVQAQLDASVATVKADAARASFAATGRGIVWAVLDSGVCADHPHFSRYSNCRDLPPGLEHRNFIDDDAADKDPFGHGTHVAGIIAGEASVTKGFLSASRSERDQDDRAVPRPAGIRTISGVAPECTILSYRVLNQAGIGNSGAMLDALQAVHEVNNYGRLLRIHGVNISAGYTFKPEWFACGQSPLCTAVDRLVRSGVIVVVSAGNTGYAYAADAFDRGPVAAGRALTINDPGNAELAITVGSTHRDSPHLYGVSYFSSKGPTGDGRAKPDLIAPGERILSAGAGTMRDKASGNGPPLDYIEHSGTSMAAPHVSGAIGAFLSVRREFIGRPEEVKRIFMQTATDLGRVREFQGHGLVDLMRAIQYV
jgi:serine protease AprX